MVRAVFDGAVGVAALVGGGVVVAVEGVDECGTSRVDKELGLARGGRQGCPDQFESVGNATGPPGAR